MGVMRYFAGSAARNTWAAVVHDTSCSADCPPNRTTRWMRSSDASPFMPRSRYRSARIAARTATVPAVRMRASEIAAAVGGRLVGPDADVDGASFDTRTLRPGQLFVPIVAARDGHDFVDDARRAGAAAVLTARPVAGGGEPAVTSIEVADTATALMALATAGRRRLDATVVGITGSVGKTTTKDLAAAACTAGRRTTANERSFNNEQGLPVTILGAPDDTEVLIVEMGMRGLGHIRTLCDVARPDIGLVTVVGESHTELLGGIDGVATAKGELIEALPATGTAVLNADDQRVLAMAARTDATVVTFGTRGDVRVTAVVLDDAGCAAFDLESPWGSGRVRLPMPGRHLVANAAGALAVAGLVGVSLDAAIDAVGRADVSAMRMQRIATTSGAVIVNDAYNANPTSMRAALDALASMRAQRKIAVLGAMGELADPGPAHLDIAAHADSLELELVATGTDAYGRPGLVDVADVVAAVGELGDGDVVLVKASRAAALELVADALVSAAGGPAAG